MCFVRVSTRRITCSRSLFVAVLPSSVVASLVTRVMRFCKFNESTLSKSALVTRMRRGLEMRMKIGGRGVTI